MRDLFPRYILFEKNKYLNFLILIIKKLDLLYPNNEYNANMILI